MSYHPRKKRREISHADDWLMTYADMITLLLCFFAIFLSVSLPKKDAQKVQPPQAAEQPAKPPVVPEDDLPFPNLARVEEPAADEADKIPVKSQDAVMVKQESNVAAPPVPDQAMPYAAQPEIPDAPQLPAIADSERKEDNAIVPAVPVIAPAPIAPVLNEPKPPAASLPEIVEHLKLQGPAHIEQKGDRITTMEMNSAAFFGRGSATLSEAGKAVLRDVVTNIQSDKFKDYRVTVEGHTDDTPIKTVQFPSNWELSTARAAAVVHFFLDQGISAQRLRAAGYADTFPKAPNRDAAGHPIPANQAQNRRVVIDLEKIDKPD